MSSLQSNGSDLMQSLKGLTPGGSSDVVVTSSSRAAQGRMSSTQVGDQPADVTVEVSATDKEGADDMLSRMMGSAGLEDTQLKIA